MAQSRRDLDVERRETTFVLANQLTVQKHSRLTVHRTEMDEGAAARLGDVIKPLSVPNGTFVEKELGALTVPIAGHLKGR